MTDLHYRVQCVGPSILFALVSAACATTGTTGEVQAEVISAREYLHGYWNQPAQSDAKFRGREVVVMGLVENRQGDLATGPVLHLQTDERRYFVRCLLSPSGVATSSDLERGQLVAVRGTGKGVRQDMPELGGCEVAWKGDRPGSRSTGSEKAALLSAYSANLCATVERRRALAQMHLDPNIPQVKKEREETTRREARYRELLAGSGGAPLACNHPLVPILIRCAGMGLFAELGAAPMVEGDRIFVSPTPTREEREAGSECASPQVVDALDVMRSHE